MPLIQELRNPRCYRVLLATPTLIRDCWISNDDQDQSKSVMTIRQTRYEDDGLGEKEVKLFRLTEPEMLVIFSIWTDQKLNQ